MVIGFVVIGCGVYFLYENRERIADHVLHDGREPSLAIDTFLSSAAKLLRDTHSDLVVLAEINLDDNLARDRVGVLADGTRWVPIDGPQPIFYHDTDLVLVIRFLHNEVICGDTEGRPGDDMQALSRAGFPRVCLVVVPPTLGASVGALYAAWKTPLDVGAERRAGLVLTAAALTLAKY